MGKFEGLPGLDMLKCERQLPYGLLSLWDMERIYAEKLVDIGQRLYAISLAYIEARGGGVADGIIQNPLDDDQRDLVKSTLKELIKICDTIDFKVSGDALSMAYDDLPRTLREFEIISRGVISELKSRKFFHIQSHKASFYENDKLLSDAVLASFPKAAAELKMAANCFATDLNTACVFHCMRAAEIGVWAIGKAVGVSFPDKPIELADIHPILDQVESKIAGMKDLARGAEKEAKLAFYSQAATQFRYFKDGWRVRVAHARATYGEAEAKKILEHTKDFFEDLSPTLYEEGSLTEILS